MFILDIEVVPQASSELASAINSSLANWIELPADRSVVHAAGTLPNLSSVTVDVSHGQIASVNSLPFQSTTGKIEPGPTADSFLILGHPISIAGIPIQLDLTAAKASFGYARNSSKKLIATLLDAVHGELSVQLSHTDLEIAALKIARQFAGDNVAIQKVDIRLTAVSAAQVDVLLTITAKKFVTAIVKVSGRVTINDQMIATANNLKATSEGMVGNIAVNLLQPHLQKLQGRPLPLLAFSLGNVKLRGVQIHTTDGLQITASFGS